MAIACACCSKNIARYDEYICCKNKYNRNYHLKCGSVSVEECVQMKTDGTIREWTCPECSAGLTSNNNMKSSDSSKTTEVGMILNTSLQQFISSKMEEAVKNITETLVSTFRTEIKKLVNENKTLCREIAELKSTMKVEEPVEIQERTTVEDAHQHNDIPTKKEITTGKRENNILNKNGRLATSVEKMKTNIKENIDKLNRKSSSTKNSINTQDFKTIAAKKKKRHLIHGTAENNLVIKAVEKQAHIHVCGLSVETNEEDLKNYLMSHGIRGVACEKLQA